MGGSGGASVSGACDVGIESGDVAIVALPPGDGSGAAVAGGGALGCGCGALGCAWGAG